MNKRAQIWVETVVYTLIGLALIGLVLTIITPKINELKDRKVIEQTIDSLNAIDSKINEVLSAPGNVRIVEIELNKGEIYFDNANDLIRFELSESKSLFSEPDVEVFFGKVKVKTTEGVKRHKVELFLEYGIDLKNEDGDGLKKISQASVPYRLSIENRGAYVNIDSI